MFNFSTASAIGIAGRPSSKATVAHRWSRALLAFLIGTAGTVEAAGSTAPFFYDLLSPQLRLDTSLPKAAGLSIFEQSRKIASPLTFPMAPFAAPVTQALTAGEDVAIEGPAHSEERLFDSVTIIFDAAEETGIHQVLAGALAELTARGATGTESCSDTACGDAQRWSDRFKLYGAGSNEQQAYHRLTIPASDTGEKHFVSDIFEVYATRLGCCIRLAVSHHKPNNHQYSLQQNGALDPQSFPHKPFSVQFDKGQDEFPVSQRRVLSHKVNALRSCSTDRPILLEGHADSTGSRVANRALSERRIASVRAALLAAGIPEACLLTAAYGDTSPDSASATEQRKVVIRMLSSGWSGAAVASPLDATIDDTPTAPLAILSSSSPQN